MMDDKDERWRTKQFFSNLTSALIMIALVLMILIFGAITLADLINAGLDRLMQR